MKIFGIPIDFSFQEPDWKQRERLIDWHNETMDTLEKLEAKAESTEWLQAWQRTWESSSMLTNTINPGGNSGRKGGVGAMLIIILVLLLLLLFVWFGVRGASKRQAGGVYTLYAERNEGKSLQEVQTHSDPHEIEETAEDWLCDGTIAAVVIERNGQRRRISYEDYRRQDGVYL